MPLLPRNLAWLELWGLSLLLAASGFELFVVQPLRETSASAISYKVDAKLDYLWELTAQTARMTQGEPPRRIDINERASRWNSLFESEKAVEQQAGISSWGLAVVFMLGTVLVVIGRYYDIKQQTPTAIP